MCKSCGAYEVYTYTDVYVYILHIDRVTFAVTFAVYRGSYVYICRDMNIVIFHTVSSSHICTVPI